MGFAFHPSLIIFKIGNYKQWRDGILKHPCWLHLLPYLYGLGPQPSTTCKKNAWTTKNEPIMGLIGLYVNDATWGAIAHIECPHALQIKVWKIYGDRDTQPFPNYHVSNCLYLLMIQTIYHMIMILFKSFLFWRALHP